MYWDLCKVVVQGRAITIVITISINVITITIHVMIMPVYQKLFKVVVQGRTASCQGQTRIPGSPDGHRCTVLYLLFFLLLPYEVIGCMSGNWEGFRAM